jgi:putative oxidoreductase
MQDNYRFVNVGARVLMASLFLVAGIRKLLTWKMTLGYFSTLGVPFPALALPLTVFVEIGGSVALIAAWRLREVALVMAAFTIFTALAAHRFWVADASQFSNQLNHFFKNFALAGGFLVLYAGAWRHSLSRYAGTSREDTVAR